MENFIFYAVTTDVLWLCWTCYEWLLQFEPVTIDIIIQTPWPDSNLILNAIFLEKERKYLNQKSFK